MNDFSKYSELSASVVKMARNTLIVNLRFMDTALSRLQSAEYPGTVCTDGHRFLYDPVHILKSYKHAKEVPPHIYLHVVMHCIFQHFFVDIGTVDPLLWDIACDMAVEAVILDLRLKSVQLDEDSKRAAALSTMKSQCKYLTAECIYRYLLEAGKTEDELFHLGGLFRFDDHSNWYEVTPVVAISEEKESDGDGDDNSAGTVPLMSFRAELRKEWKSVSESMQTDMETFSKRQGTEAGNLMQNLAAVNREKYDYTSFLKKFSVMGEAMKINDDEFDYIFYTYGMQLYDRKMPLIEPLEYKEVKRIKEFVIAIDTSGSVQGELVQKFLNKTYNILKQEESFFTKINLHIIQCDTRITESAKITSRDDFDNYLKNMKLKGFGGTDFRPAFRYVDNMIKQKEFTNLKGMIYFTDGFGEFPSKQPNYQTAFVYIDDEYNDYNVPVWAIKLILQSDEI